MLTAVSRPGAGWGARAAALRAPLVGLPGVGSCCWPQDGPAGKPAQAPGPRHGSTMSRSLRLEMIGLKFSQVLSSGWASTATGSCTTRLATRKGAWGGMSMKM
jgi:hypothetical protein